MKLGILSVLLLCTGCSVKSIEENARIIAFKNVANADVSYNAAVCTKIKNSCPDGSYGEWR